MPGLIGFTDKHHKYNSNMLLKIRGYLRYFDDYIDEKIYSDKDISVLRTHLGIIKKGKQPYICKDRFTGWLEGEFYNQNKLRDKYKVA